MVRPGGRDEYHRWLPIVAEGDKVWALLATSSRRTGEWMSLPATGKAWTNRVALFCRLANDKIVQWVVIPDIGNLGSEPPRSPAVIADPPDQHAGTPLERWNSSFWRSLGEPWGGMVTTPAGTLGLRWFPLAGMAALSQGAGTIHHRRTDEPLVITDRESGHGVLRRVQRLRRFCRSRSRHGLVYSRHSDGSR